MHYPLLQYINFAILLALILLVRNAWINFLGEFYGPPAWESARKSKMLSPELLKAKRKYDDKVRFYNFWLQIRRIEKDGIPGDFAELGVYKGESARLIHLMAPGRKLHLFDTFEGFPLADLEPETGAAAKYSVKDFADTSVNKVLRKIGDHANVEVHAGYFPGSAKGLDNVVFALVNIDADLYNPVKAGLDFFYPRLSPGGVILVHDYNDQWKGLMRAVDEFTETIPEAPVPVPDDDGTIMIVKSAR